MNVGVLPAFKFRNKWSLQLGLATLLLVTPANSAFSEDYTPDSEKVRQMVDRGVGFLESRGATGHGVGYEILMGYTVFKATDNPEHPIVLNGLSQAKTVAKSSTSKGGDLETLHEYNYVLSVSIQLMAAVDPVAYAGDLQNMLKYYINRQKASGAYGYQHEPYLNQGDTSQTQYVLLGMWALDHANVEVPTESVERAFNWLKDTQYGDGGWAYQFPANGQYRQNHVMTAVGMSAVMIAGDIMGVLRGGGGSAMDALDGADQDYGVPVVFRRVIEEKDGGKKVAVSQGTIAASAARADRWIASNAYQRQPGQNWHYYYLYSIERYQAFAEAMKGKREKSPQWYNDIVEGLIKNQNGEGAWGRNDPDAGSAESSTCFAILTLLRTTQKSIGDISEAVATGGWGLQADMSSVDVKSGKVEDKKAITDMDQALSMLETDGATKDVSDDLAKRIRLDADPKVREQQLDRFARLIRNGNSMSRRVAAKVLCRGDNMDMVPFLIYALSDPDAKVNQNAENSLRVLSRQLNTYKIPLENEVEFPLKVRQEAQDYWKAWYKTVRPDYIFLE